MYNTKSKINPAMIVKKITEEKEGRSKNIYYFTLSMSVEQEQIFNKKLKRLINAINDHDDD